MSAEFQVQMPAAIVQLEAYYAANWAVADWYIDGTTGSDSNNGTSAATPLKTGAELQRRLGPYARWSHSVTVHVLANGMIDGLALHGLMTTIDTHVDVIGTPTVLASDVLSSYSGVDHTIPRATEIKGTAILDFAPYVWKRVRITSGARVGWVSWIAQANPAGVVGAARCSPGVALSEVSTSSPFVTNLVPAALDPFVIESLPSVPSICVELDGVCDSNAATAIYPQRMLAVRDVVCKDIALASVASKRASRQFIFGCSVAAMKLGGNIRNNSCSPVYGSLISANLSTTYHCTGPAISHCLIGDGCNLYDMAGEGAYVFSCLSQGARLSGSIPCIIGSTQIFGVTSTVGAIQTYSTVGFVLSNVSGAENTFGIGIVNNAILSYAGTINLLGSTSECKLITAPTVNLTKAQAFQPNDYAQKGVATLVGGTVTVTVPWYDNTIQRVTATRNVADGTTSDLKVAQISNSQFTITSQSALDTSTVNWAISPLGRGISVSPV